MIDYDKAERKRLLENIQLLRDNITDESILVKIKKWSKKYDLHPEYVKYKVFTDDIFALNFTKEPSKQNLHEDLAANTIKNWDDLIISFMVLPKKGKGAKVIDKNGNIIYLEDSNQAESITKTIDFQWEIYKQETGEVITCYASHKHTKESGGGQDNQYNDIKLYMQLAILNEESNVMFFAICDGKYYQIKNRKTKTTKLEDLNINHSMKNKSTALTIDNLREYLEKIMYESDN